MMATLVRGHRRKNCQRGGIIFRFLFLLFLICVAFVLYLARHPLLRLAGNFWIVDDPPAASDVIVILGDDNYGGDRAARAAELYKAGWAPRLLASGRYLRSYASISELEEHDLEAQGVPAHAITRLAHHAENTREESMAVGDLAAARGWKRILVVTSSYHTRRALFICERTFPAGTQLRVAAAQDSEYDPDNWWRTRLGVKIFVHELAGIMVAMWELRHNTVRVTRSAAGLTDPPEEARRGRMFASTCPVNSRTGVARVVNGTGFSCLHAI